MELIFHQRIKLVFYEGKLPTIFRGFPLFYQEFLCIVFKKETSLHAIRRGQSATLAVPLCHYILPPLQYEECLEQVISLSLSHTRSCLPLNYAKSGVAETNSNKIQVRYGTWQVDTLHRVTVTRDQAVVIMPGGAHYEYPWHVACPGRHHC